MDVMRYNDYETDPLSQGNPSYAIAWRGDLPPMTGAPNIKGSGGIDAKVITWSRPALTIHYTSKAHSVVVVLFILCSFAINQCGIQHSLL